MSDEDDDLLGPPPKRGPGRPKGSKTRRPSPMLHDELDRHLAYRKLERMDAAETPSLHVSDVHAGVTVGWLSQVFNMDPTSIKKRLADCPPLHRRKAGFVYDLKTAAPYLVKPVFDVNKYLRGMKPNELPPQLRKEYWDASLKQQAWEENAGDLWRTKNVLEVFSDTFLMMKSTMQLWTEDLERIDGLTSDQRATVVRLVDELQNEIHRNLVEMKARRRTPSMREEIVIDNPLDEEEEDLVG